MTVVPSGSWPVPYSGDVPSAGSTAPASVLPTGAIPVSSGGIIPAYTAGRTATRATTDAGPGTIAAADNMGVGIYGTDPGTTGLVTTVAGSAEEYGADVVPTMTSASDPSGEATDDAHSGPNVAWHALDKDQDTSWAMGQADVLSLPHYMQYRFAAARCISKYAIYSTGTTPNSWVFAGSNDGTTFLPLDSQSNIVAWEPNGPGSVFNIYTFSNATAYLYYRLTVSQANYDTCVITGLTMHEDTLTYSLAFNGSSADGNPYSYWPPAAMTMGALTFTPSGSAPVESGSDTVTVAVAVAS